MSSMEEESRQFAKHWHSQIARGMIAVLIGAFLFLVFSPKNILEYLAYSLFIAPFFIWAYKSPGTKKKRVITSIVFYIASAVIYFGWIQIG